MEDRNARATKGDITDLRSGLNSELNQKIDQLRSEMSHSHQELIATALPAP